MSWFTRNTSFFLALAILFCKKKKLDIEITSWAEKGCAQAATVLVKSWIFNLDRAQNMPIVYYKWFKKESTDRKFNFDSTLYIYDFFALHLTIMGLLLFQNGDLAGCDLRTLVALDDFSCFIFYKKGINMKLRILIHYQN